MNNLLFLHDIRRGSSSDVWASLTPAFLKRGYRVFAPDLPGFGSCPLNCGGVTTYLYAKFISEYIKNEIGDETLVITAGKTSASLAVLADKLSPGFVKKMFVLDIDILEDEIIKTAFSVPILGAAALALVSKTPLSARVGSLFVNDFYQLIKDLNFPIGLMPAKRRQYCVKQFFKEAKLFFNTY